MIASARPLAPGVYANYIEALSKAGRLEQADRAVEDAMRLYPSDEVLRDRRYEMLRNSGHASAAIAMLQDSERPAATNDQMVREMKVARAIETRDPLQIQAVIDDQMRLARQGSAYAGEAILLANALGQEDQAFAIAEAYYFGRGFVVPDRRSPTAIYYSPPNERHTRMLFDPVSRPMRADPRFARLVEELGLERYWREVPIAARLPPRLNSARDRQNISFASASRPPAARSRRTSCSKPEAHFWRCNRKEETMTILKAAIALAAITVPAVALAHTPVDVPYDTRGECEAQMAKDNIFHARDKVEQGRYDNVGEAMADMHEHFWCELNPEDGYWYMLRTPF